MLACQEGNEILEGRWLTPDPLGGDIGNPQSLNRYAYALNNPTTLTDPLGLDPTNCHVATLPDGTIGIQCSGPDTITVNGGGCSPSDFACFSQFLWSIGQVLDGIEVGMGLGNGSSGDGGGIITTPPPAPKPAPPPLTKPDVPLNAFATAVFHRVYCGTQFLDRLPSISGGGGFLFLGPNFTIPLTPVKGSILGVLNYDTRAGTSAGFIGEAGAGPVSAGAGRVYDFRSGQWNSETLGFFGAEREGASIGVLGGGALITTQGSVGLYGQIGPVGGGGYLNLSYNACAQ